MHFNYVLGHTTEESTYQHNRLISKEENCCLPENKTRALENILDLFGLRISVHALPRIIGVSFAVPDFI